MWAQLERISVFLAPNFGREAGSPRPDAIQRIAPTFRKSADCVGTSEIGPIGARETEHRPTPCLERDLSEPGPVVIARRTGHGRPVHHIL